MQIIERYIAKVQEWESLVNEEEKQDTIIDEIQEIEKEMEELGIPEEDIIAAWT